MKMRRFLAAITLFAAALMVAASTASADVARYQLQHGTITVTWAGSLVHDFTVDLNPCDGSFTGTGTSDQGALQVREHVTGALTADHFSFYSTYDDDMPLYGDYWWTYDGPRTGGLGSDFFGAHFAVNSVAFNLVNVSDFKNHGEYVKTMGGGADAAHACIGMPVVSQPLEWSTTGAVDSASATGTNVALPRPGTYRIDVNGTWDNGVWYGVDAEWVQQADLSWAQGWPGYPTVDFGDLQVNGQFVDWGAYSSAHSYTYTGAFPTMAVNLAVWDSWSDLVTDGHTDNVGSLAYTITYVGP